MFERFTDRARHVIVLAQEEARGLQHNYIGTEHLLLGLLSERRGLAARALDRFDLSLAIGRAEVIDRIGHGKKPMSGHIPFTPRAKRVLELGLREALQLQHNYIGTEHLLLGLIREGEGVGAQILTARAGDLVSVRMAVLDVLQSVPRTIRGPRWRRSGWPLAAGQPGEQGEPGEQGSPGGQARLSQSGEPEELRATPAADTSLSEAARLAGTRPVGSHHLLLAALADPDTAAARTLAGLGLDLAAVSDALRQADVTGTSDEQPEEAGRRQMQVRVTGSSVVIEATDPMIIELGQAAVRALSAQARPASKGGEGGETGEGGEAGEAGEAGETGEAGTIGGNLAAAASLSDVWQALRVSLEDISRRAAAGASVSESARRARRPERSPRQKPA